jgi:hypothetical protein
MALRAADDAESRVVAYVEELTSVIGHADGAEPRCRASAKCRADSDSHGTGTSWGTASIAAALRWRGELVGRKSNGAARIQRPGSALELPALTIAHLTRPPGERMKSDRTRWCSRRALHRREERRLIRNHRA